MSRQRSAATLLPSGLSSTATTPDCLTTKPSVKCEAAVGEEPRGALHRGDFMQQFAGEENDLVLLRHDGLIAAFAHIDTVFQERIMDAQLSAFELARFAL